MRAGFRNLSRFVSRYALERSDLHPACHSSWLQSGWHSACSAGHTSIFGHPKHRTLAKCPYKSDSAGESLAGCQFRRETPSPTPIHTLGIIEIYRIGTTCVCGFRSGSIYRQFSQIRPVFSARKRRVNVRNFIGERADKNGLERLSG